MESPSLKLGREQGWVRKGLKSLPLSIIELLAKDGL